MNTYHVSFRLFSLDCCAMALPFWTKTNTCSVGHLKNSWFIHVVWIAFMNNVLVEKDNSALFWVLFYLVVPPSRTTEISDQRFLSLRWFSFLVLMDRWKVSTFILLVVIDCDHLFHSCHRVKIEPNLVVSLLYSNLLQYLHATALYLSISLLQPPTSPSPFLPLPMTEREV